jgi:hypothetical protein
MIMIAQPITVAKFAAMIGAGCLLAGCGGGGGGSGSSATVSVPSTAVVAKGGSAQIFIPASAVGPSASPAGSGSINASLVQSAGTAAATLTTAPGGASSSLTAGNIQTGTIARNTTIAAAAPDQLYASAPVSPSNSLTVQHNVGAAAPLTDAAFGLAYTASAGSAYVGGYHYGNATALASMPTATATYAGKFSGIEVSRFGIGDIKGTSALTANFGAGTVNGNVTNMTLGSGGSAGYGLSMNGTITGNTYSGTTGFTTTTGAPTVSVTASSMNGGFYGAGAAETAGALTVQGTPLPTTTLGPVAVVGAFGGKK